MKINMSKEKKTRKVTGHKWRRRHEEYRVKENTSKVMGVEENT